VTAYPGLIIQKLWKQKSGMGGIEHRVCFFFFFCLIDCVFNVCCFIVLTLPRAYNKEEKEEEEEDADDRPMG